MFNKPLFDIPDRTITEDQILKEIGRIQAMVMCTNLLAETRYMLSSVFDAAFIVLDRELPNYMQRSHLIN